MALRSSAVENHTLCRRRWNGKVGKAGTAMLKIGWLRRKVRAARRTGHFPVRVPHVETVAGQAETGRALALCDGTRSLREVAEEAGISAAEVLRLHDEGRIVLWRSPLAGQLPKHGPVSWIIFSPHPDD